VIPVADIDDIIKKLMTDNKVFHYDNFASTEHVSETVTSTAAVTRTLQSVLLETGVLSTSTAKAYYSTNIFNPKLSDFIFKARLSSIADVLAFIGFTETLADPVYNSVESHAGLLIYNDHVYFSTGFTDGVTTKYRNTEIKGLDPTRWLVYRITGHAFSWYSIPVVVPYFDDFYTTDAGKVWSQVTMHSDTMPLNMVHYFTAYIANETNENKTLELAKLLHVERHPD